MLKRVRVMMQSERFGVAARLFEDMIDGVSEADEYVAAMFAPAPNEEGNFDEPEHMEMFCDGRLRLTDDMFSLSYEESELTGMEGSITAIGFQRNNPALMSMMRSGPVRTALTFEEGKRHYCLYNTPLSDFEVCVRAVRVHNRLLEEGEVYLDYLIEIHGAQAEHCRMTVSVRNAEELGKIFSK